jgi:RNA-directed DNA polymerase
VAASFDEISQDWLIRFLEHRIGDRRIIRLVQKWLKAGILEDGVVSVSDRGTGQGSVISPLPCTTRSTSGPCAGDSARPRAI